MSPHPVQQRRADSGAFLASTKISLPARPFQSCLRCSRGAAAAAGLRVLPSKPASTIQHAGRRAIKILPWRSLPNSTVGYFPNPARFSRDKAPRIIGKSSVGRWTVSVCRTHGTGIALATPCEVIAGAARSGPWPCNAPMALVRGIDGNRAEHSGQGAGADRCARTWPGARTETLRSIRTPIGSDTALVRPPGAVASSTSRMACTKFSGLWSLDRGPD